MVLEDGSDTGMAKKMVGVRSRLPRTTRPAM